MRDETVRDETMPVDELLVSKFPVVIESVVPAGFPLDANVTLILVLFTTKLVTPGDDVHVYVAIVPL